MYAGGVWYNELGSYMNMTVSGSTVWGTYRTAVGHASGTYDFYGRIDPSPGPYGQALGWTVAWANPYGNSHSATAWSGQYESIGSREEIVALWLLTSETPESQDWASTLVGKDVFTRTPPAPEEIETNRRRVAPSHPTE